MKEQEVRRKKRGRGRPQQGLELRDTERRASEELRERSPKPYLRERAALLKISAGHPVAHLRAVDQPH